MATPQGTAKGTTAHTEADGHGKAGFPPFQKETFASQLVSFAIAFALLYFIVSKFALPRVGGIISNREGVIAEVIRSLLPAIDDLDRAEAHGELTEGSPLTIVAQKLRAAFEKYGLTKVGEKGERFDPKLHEALVRLPSADVEFDTVADVIEPGYLLGERLIRAARVAVSSPE